MASTIKVTNIDTPDGSGNITVDRPLSGSGASLTSLPAANLTGTISAISGANLTALNATQLTSGTVPTARLGSGTANSGVFLRGDGTWQTAGSTSASDLTSGTLPMARLSGTLPALNGSALTDLPGTMKTSSWDGQYSANGTGTITVSSLGFAPKYVSCIVLDNTSRDKFSIGFASYRASTITASQYVLYDDEVTSSVDWSAYQGYIGYLSWASGNYARLAVSTWGSDSIVFTKTTNQSGTSAFAFKINILG